MMSVDYNPAMKCVDIIKKINSNANIKSYDSYRRNPTEAKIKGVDYEFLYWAMQESMTGQKRLLSFIKHRVKTIRYFPYLWSAK